MHYYAFYMPLQGLMFGYATDETPQCMPVTILWAHQLNMKLRELRNNGQLPWARPDSKSQVFTLSLLTLVDPFLHKILITRILNSTCSAEKYGGSPLF